MVHVTMERSVGMILIIPFGICFVLLFLVCCFADEMKKMCILPSQIPPSYRSSSPVFNTSRRHESSTMASSRQNNRLDQDDIENQGFAVEQAETEQLINDDLILTAVEIPAQISMRPNTIGSLQYLQQHCNNYQPHQITIINNNNNNIHNNNNNNNNNVSNNNNNDDESSIHPQYHPQSDIRRSRSSIVLGNNNCINRPLQYSSYIQSRHLGDLHGQGIEEAETSLIPPIIFRNSFQNLQHFRNSVSLDCPEILNDDVTSPDLISSRSVDDTTAKQHDTNFAHQMEVSVSVNNLSMAHIHRLSQSTDN